MAVEKPKVKKFCSWCWHRFVVLVASLIITLALIFSVARLSLPYLNDWRDEIAQKVSEKIGYDVDIESINVTWQKLYPSLHFVNTEITDGTKQLASVGQLVFSLDIIQSILNLDLKLQNITAVNTRFDLERDQNKNWIFNSVPLNQKSEQDTKSIVIPEALKGIKINALRSQFSFKDAIKGKEYFFDDLSVSVSNTQDRYQLYISNKLSSILGNNFDIGIDITGDLNQPKSLVGKTYMNVNGADLSELTHWLEGISWIKSGTLHGSVWFDFSNDTQDVYVDLQGENVKLDAEKVKEKNLQNLNGEFNRLELKGQLKKEDKDFTVFFPSIKIIDDASESDKSFADDLLLSVSETEEGDKKFIASYDEVSLEVMSKIFSLMPDSEFKKNLKGVSLLGSIKDGFIRCGGVADKQDASEALVEAGAVSCEGKSQFEKFDYIDKETDVNLTGFSGNIFYRSNQLFTHFNSENLIVNIPSVFIAPLNLDSFSAISWLDLQSGSLLLRNASGKKGESVFNGDLDLKLVRNDKAIDGDKSTLKVKSKLGNFNAEDVKYYLPLKLMKDDFASWVESALYGGALNDAEFIADTTLKDFNGKSKKAWQIKAGLKDVGFNFDNKWPNFNKVNGSIFINNKGMFVEANDAITQNMKVNDSYIWIDDFDAKRIKGDLNVTGTLSNLKAYMENSTMGDGKEELLDSLTMSGRHESVLKLDLPLEKNRQPLIDIQMILNKASIHEKNTDMFVSDIPSGTKLYISEASFSAEPFSAKINNYPARLSVSTEQNSRTGLATSTIAYSAELPLSEFWPDHQTPFPYWMADITGKSMHDVELSFPLNLEKVNASLVPINSQFPLVSVNTNFEGTEINMPQPAKKEKLQKINTQINLSLRDDEFYVGRVNVDNISNSIFTARVVDEKLLVEKAHVVVNSTIKPKLKKDKGIYIDGHLQNLHLDNWLDYLDKAPVDDEENELINSIELVDLIVDSTHYLDRVFPNTFMRIAQNDKDWLIDSKNNFFDGSVELPKSDILDSEIRIDADFIDMNKLPEAKVGDVEVIKPEEVPLIQLTLDNLKFTDLAFNNIVLNTSRNDTGIQIEKFIVDDKFLKVDGGGSWTKGAAGNIRTDFFGKMTTTNLGEALKTAGYAEFIEKGEGTFNFDLHWFSSPNNYSAKGLKGSVNARFKDGNLLAVDPGAGRLVSLISLTALPKRLLLDFKDIGSEGYFFEDMRGDFVFSNGIARTGNFLIKSNLGKIRVDGDANLIDQTYDQRLRFTPDLSASLPVLASIVSGGSAGVGFLVLDGVARMFGGQLDNIGLVTYDIKGPWDEPVITPVDVKKVGEFEDEDDDNN